MSCFKPLFVLVSLLVLSSIGLAGGDLAGGSTEVEERYARLEVESRGLEAFTGGGRVTNGAVTPLSAASGELASAGEIESYARREAASPGLADFEGGIHGLIITLAVIAAIVIIVYLLVPWKK